MKCERRDGWLAIFLAWTSEYMVVPSMEKDYRRMYLLICMPPHSRKSLSWLALILTML